MPTNRMRGRGPTRSARCAGRGRRRPAARRGPAARVTGWRRPPGGSRMGAQARSRRRPDHDKEAPMATALSPDIRKLIDGPNFAHLATLMPDGSPQSAPVWVTREGDRILVGTGEGSLKAKNTR